MGEHPLNSLLFLPPLPGLCIQTPDNPSRRRIERNRPSTHPSFPSAVQEHAAILLPAWSLLQEGQGYPAAHGCLSEPAIRRICFLPASGTVSSDPWNQKTISREVRKVTFISSTILLNVAFTTKVSLYINQLQGGLGSGTACMRKRFLPSEYDYNQPQKQNSSCKLPHPTGTATLLPRAASALLLEHRLKTTWQGRKRRLVTSVEALKTQNSVLTASERERREIRKKNNMHINNTPQIIPITGK